MQIQETQKEGDMPMEFSPEGDKIVIFLSKSDFAESCPAGYFDVKQNGTPCGEAGHAPAFRVLCLYTECGSCSNCVAVALKYQS